MTKAALLRFLEELAGLTSAKLGLCCHREIVNLPRVVRHGGGA
ncbi:MAG TPA: hypothetical protein VIG90_13700 [Pedomonas sp.]